MKVTIDQDGCIGCGLCAETCPEVFRMNDESIAEVYGEATEVLADQVHEAAENCPVGVINVEE